MMKPLGELLSLRSADSLIARIIEPYIELIESMDRAYIYGTREEALSAYDALRKRGVEVLAFLSDVQAGETLRGLPVIEPGDVEDRAIAVIIAGLGAAGAMREKLATLGFRRYVDYPILHRYSSDLFPLPIHHRFYDCELQRETVRNREKYPQAYELLADEASRQVFQAVVSYRLTLDSSPLRSVMRPANEQYFDPIVQLSSTEVFVDGGAWIGDTTIELAKRVPSYSRIYLFEPDTKVMALARDNTAHLSNLVFHARGLYSTSTSLRFNATGSSNGAIHENGTETVEVVALDECINEAITYIKMDIEGSEMDALQGARKHIVSSKPKLAISAYHKSCHLWEIPSYIDSLEMGYRLYLRTYGAAHEEIVLYCV